MAIVNVIIVIFLVNMIIHSKIWVFGERNVILSTIVDKLYLILILLKSGKPANIVFPHTYVRARAWI